MSARPESTSVSAMREAFDAAFTRPPRGLDESKDHYLALRVAGRGHAVTLAEVGGLEPVRRIVPLPGGAAPLLGLSAIRGHLVPVYALAALLALEGADERPRWLLVSRGEEPVAFAVSQLEGLLELPRAARIEEAGKAGVVQTDGELRTLLSLSSLVHALVERARP